MMKNAKHRNNIKYEYHGVTGIGIEGRGAFAGLVNNN